MMHTSEMLHVFSQQIAANRGDTIVISGRGGKHWIELSNTALDIPLGDPAMGGHAGFGLGWPWRNRTSAWCCLIPRAIS